MFNYLPLFAVATASVAGFAGIYYATYSVRSQLLGPTIWRGRTDTGSVALTFDDGPSDDTLRILDTLAEHEINATFFVVGRQVERYPHLARRIVADGHEIGNHSYSHPIFLYRGARETRRQLERTQQIIFDATGVKAEVARPPCGVRTPAYFAAAKDLGLRTIQWSVAGGDWKQQSSTKIAEQVLNGTNAGSIILLHDGDSELKNDRRATVEALPLIFRGLKSRNLNIAPLRQLWPEVSVRATAMREIEPTLAGSNQHES